MKNGALAFLSAAHAPKAKVGDAFNGEASSRRREETLAESSRPTFPPVRLGLWTGSKI